MSTPLSLSPAPLTGLGDHSYKSVLEDDYSTGKLSLKAKVASVGGGVANYKISQTTALDNLAQEVKVQFPWKRYSLTPALHAHPDTTSGSAPRARTSSSTSTWASSSSSRSRTSSSTSRRRPMANRSSASAPSTQARTASRTCVPTFTKPHIPRSHLLPDLQRLEPPSAHQHQARQARLHRRR